MNTLSLFVLLVSLVFLGWEASPSFAGTHIFTLCNHCGNAMTGVVESQGGATTPLPLDPGACGAVQIDGPWYGGRIWADNGNCPYPDGPGCTLSEWTLDDPNNSGTSTYDIDIEKGFSYGIAIGVNNPTCGSSSCSSPQCQCNVDAFCGPYDYGAQRYCGDQNAAYSVTFCP